MSDPVIATVIHPELGAVNIHKKPVHLGETYVQWPSGGRLPMYGCGNCETQEDWQAEFESSCLATRATAEYCGDNWTGDGRKLP